MKEKKTIGNSGSENKGNSRRSRPVSRYFNRDNIKGASIAFATAPPLERLPLIEGAGVTGLTVVVFGSDELIKLAKDHRNRKKTNSHINE